MHYRIAIQVLSFHRPKYLRRTLESLYERKGPRDKVLVVEQSAPSGAQKECLEICRRFSALQVKPLKIANSYLGGTRRHAAHC